MNFRKACLFIDGENLRHSICDLFTQDQFHPTEYLPKSAAWQLFFDHLVTEANADLRLRTYWYAVAEIDFWPYDIKKLLKPTEFVNLFNTVQKNELYRAELAGYNDIGERDKRVRAIGEELQTRQQQMLNRFNGWHTFQNGIASTFRARLVASPRIPPDNHDQ